MLEKLQLMSMAQALAGHSSARLQLIAGNIANADTPGYRARDLSEFAQEYDGSAGLILSHRRAAHLQSAPQTEEVFAAGGTIGPNGNGVSVDLELAKGVQAREAHNMALSVYQAASAIIRASLGRR